MGNNISYQTILAAKAGDPIAMEQVLRRYDGYITMCAQRTMTDTYGNMIAFFFMIPILTLVFLFMVS